MSGLLAELRAKWAEALSTRSGGREWRAIALTHAAPVKVLAAIRDRDGRISVLIETALGHAPRHRVRFDAEGISLVDERSIDEGLLRLAVTLERSELHDIFEVVILDLLSVASAAPTPELAIQHTIQRLEAWQVCLRARRRGLTREEQIGLLGELAVLEFVAAGIGFDRAIAAWWGPLDGIHDFDAGGIAIEVKASVGLSHQIRISRLDQLENQGLSALVLCRTRFHEAAEGQTLTNAIGVLREQVEQSSPGAVAEFSEKLMRTGYLDSDAEIYGLTRTVLKELHGFRVNERFPRLVAATVPAAIVDVAYILDERQLQSFRMAEDELRALLRQMSPTE